MPDTSKSAARLERRMAALAARATMSPSGPALDRFRLATWNLNSLRRRLVAVAELLDRARPDVLCLQETKAATLSDAAQTMFERAGYMAVHAGVNSYNGVAIVARHAMRDVALAGELDDEHLDREPRLVTAVIESPIALRVASVYVPHGREVGHWHFEYKLAFMAALAAKVRSWLAEGHVVLAGDVNVAPTNSDVFHPDAFVGHTHVTPEERAAWAAVLDEGLVDLDAQQWGAYARRFTWWNHGIGYSRNLGMRLDVITADAKLAGRLDTTWIDHVGRGAGQPSDHAALIADFRA